MKKSILASVFAILLALVAATPAYAGTVSSSEKKAYDEFCAVIDKYVNGGILDADHGNQYKREAKNALTNDVIDFDDAAADEFIEVTKKCDQILDGSKTRHELWTHVDELLKTINPVANKYNMNVKVDSTSKYATVEIMGKAVASTSAGVKQTGFGAVQTFAVAGLAMVVLAGAFAVSRKNQLFA